MGDSNPVSMGDIAFSMAGRAKNDIADLKARVASLEATVATILTTLTEKGTA